MASHFLLGSPHHTVCMHCCQTGDEQGVRCQHGEAARLVPSWDYSAVGETDDNFQWYQLINISQVPADLICCVS